MRPIYDATVIQIDITNACQYACANCTRHVGHHRPTYLMSLECIEEAIRSLDGYGGQIGLMGGEPALHPKFREVLALWRELIPNRRQRAFWTAGWKWTEYHDDVMDTFDPDLIHYNDHAQEDGQHQPLLVAVADVVDDKELQKELIDACPFQLHWSPSITNRGAFFCEIAGSLAGLMGKQGWKVEPGWWNKTPEEFQDQVEEFCYRCGGCLPMDAHSDGRGGRDGPTVDLVSPGNMEMLLAAGSPKAARGNVQIFDRKITREEIEAKSVGWSPRSFRSFVAHNPDDVQQALGAD